MVREKSKIRIRIGEKSGIIVSGQGISKSLFKVSGKSGNFVPANTFVRYCRIDKTMLF